MSKLEVHPIDNNCEEIAGNLIHSTSVLIIHKLSVHPSVNMASTRFSYVPLLEFVLLLHAYCCCYRKCHPIVTAATTWNVGDSQGWTTMDYTHWTSGKDFKQGDALCELPYPTGFNL
jgi:hypothetical protein